MMIIYAYLFIVLGSLSLHSMKQESCSFPKNDNHFISPKTTLYGQAACKEVFYKLIDQVRSEAPYKMEEAITGSKISLMDFLECGTDLAKNGDKMAETFLLDYFENKLFRRLDSIDLYYYPRIYYVANQAIGELRGRKPFEVAMLFFSKNVSFQDCITNKDNLTDTPDGNLGTGVFESVLLHLMTEKQKIYYKNLYIQKLVHYLKNNPKHDEDSRMKEFHKMFYPIIEKDWNEGKIEVQE